MRFFFLVFVSLLSAPSVGGDSLWRTSSAVPSGDGVVLSPAEWFTSYNAEFPLGGNDGTLWQGKGLNSRMYGGFAGRWGSLTFELRPELDLSQNLNYTMIKGPGDYWWGLDRVQSYGQGGLAHLDWGETELAVAASGFRATIGTKALVLGPAQRNHVLLSDNAGGFPHIDLGTDGPFATPWGQIEGRLTWGALGDSSLYSQPTWGTSADWRLFHGLTLGYSPPFWSELTVGAARLFYSPWATVTPFKLLESLADTFWKEDRGVYAGAGVAKEDDVDQLVALFFDLDLSASGLRVYGELARNDHAGNLRDFLIQPDHTLGYVVGVAKTIPISPEWIFDFKYEQADLGLNFGTKVRGGAGSWYRHGPNPAGYTLGGQLLGAAIGPGSNGNYFEAGVSWRNSRFFASYERIANDVDYWIEALQPSDWKSGDIGMISTLGAATSLGRLSLAVTGSFVKEFNRYWVQGNDRTTWRATTSVIWKP